MLNSLAARVLDIYATKPEALAERVAEKREEGKTVHLRSVTGPEVDRPIALPRVVPVGICTNAGEARPASCQPFHRRFPAGATLRRFLQTCRILRFSSRRKIPSRLCLRKLRVFPSRVCAEPPAAVAPTSSADAEAIAALQGATSLRPVFNHFIEKGITDAEGLFAACARIKEGVPYLATMVNWQKRVRTAIAVILEKDTAQSFS